MTSQSNDPVVIASAARTAVGSFGGSLANVPAHDLGAAVIKAVIARAGIKADDVDEVILGQILTAGQGQNPGRQAAINAGCPQTTTAWLINQVCGSGLRAVALAMQQVITGAADIVIAGGQESMSMANHAALLRSGKRMGNIDLIDTMLTDALSDAFQGYHMGVTAENVAKKWQITRQQQDMYAVASQNKAEAAQKQGKFKDEIVPFTIKSTKGDTIFSADEYIRYGVTPDKISQLKPVFAKGGSVTAGNASGINDGAAAVAVMRQSRCEKLGLEPLARIVSWASAGVAPELMGIGPAPASAKALALAGWNVGDLELIESNEAFAAQACAVSKEAGFNQDIVNVNGGAIAIGHPVGASGARILNTLLFEMKRRDAGKGLATLCVGGGMGVAMCVARD